MATLPAHIRKSEVETPIARRPEDRDGRRVRVEPDPYLLRALPGEDVYLFCKRIDNSRVAREADPRARRVYGSIAAASCVIAALATISLAPRIAGTSLGYKVEALKQEQQRLLDERRMLEVEEARLLSPAQLEQLAHRHHLVTPKSEQLIDLDPKGEGSLASLQTKVR
jgi:hypothetical protein